MEKLGVVVNDEEMSKEKTGGMTVYKHEICPECEEGVVDRSGNVPTCPICGTEPFEKRSK
jgi:hypothetical protein